MIACDMQAEKRAAQQSAAAASAAAPGLDPDDAPPQHDPPRDVPPAGPSPIKPRSAAAGITNDVEASIFRRRNRSSAGVLLRLSCHMTTKTHAKSK